MEKEQVKKAEDFLGVKVLNPLEETTVVGGLGGHHHHDDEELASKAEVK